MYASGNARNEKTDGNDESKTATRRARRIEEEYAKKEEDDDREAQERFKVKSEK